MSIIPITYKTVCIIFSGINLDKTVNTIPIIRAARADPNDAPISTIIFQLVDT